jgi:hypothetical protein
MQVDQPHHAPHSIGEFVRQYAMIVLSILTALALEHVAVGIQDRQAATASRVRIEAELAGNVADLKTSEQQNRAAEAKLRTLMQALLALVKAGKPIDAPTLALLRPAFALFSISSSTWQRSAWDAAIADQSAGHLPAEALSRYSQIYAAAADEERGLDIVLGGDWLTQASDMVVDWQEGHVDPAVTVKVLARFMVASEQTENGEERLVALIQDSAPRP